MSRLPRFRMVLAFGVIGLLALAAAGCSGGGGTGTASGGASVATGDTVRVSLASTAPSPASVGPAPLSLEPSRPPAYQAVDNLFITIHRVALIPGDGDGECDPDGETPHEYANRRDYDDRPAGFVVSEIEPPLRVDLLHLPNGLAARLLNSFESVPAGTYGKIRIYYSDPEAWIAGQARPVHATANYHLDIHFKGGDLVIPVATDPDGGVRIHNVTICFVVGKDGLKVNINRDKILFRPQVFARVSRNVQYVIHGVADNVDKASGAFDLSAGGRVFPTVYEWSTLWFFRDLARFVDVEPWRGILAFDNGTTVDVLGVFDADGLLRADAVLITFPAAVTGPVVSGDTTSGWRGDNTFLLGMGVDNVAVLPIPDRAGALYDNVVPIPPPLDNGVVKDRLVTARGRFNTSGELEAYWITLGAIAGP